MKKEIKVKINQIENQLITIDLIPSSFEPIQTACGIDRDHLEEMIFEFKNDSLTKPIEKYLKSFESVTFTLKEYIDLYFNEINRLKIIQYKSKDSIHEINKAIAPLKAELIANTVVIKKQYSDTIVNPSDFITINQGFISVITQNDKKEYDMFIEKF